MHPRPHRPQPATNLVHNSTPDAYGSVQAAAWLPCQDNHSKINPAKVNTMALIRS